MGKGVLTLVDGKNVFCILDPENKLRKQIVDFIAAENWAKRMHSIMTTSNKSAMSGATALESVMQSRRSRLKSELLVSQASRLSTSNRSRMRRVSRKISVVNAFSGGLRRPT